MQSTTERVTELFADLRRVQEQIRSKQQLLLQQATGTHPRSIQAGELEAELAVLYELASERLRSLQQTLATPQQRRGRT